MDRFYIKKIGDYFEIDCRYTSITADRNECIELRDLLLREFPVDEPPIPRDRARPVTTRKDSTMRVSEAFPSKFLKAEDLRGRKVEVKIKDVEMEKIGNDYTPVMSFSGNDKTLPLNKTNALMIAKIIGTDDIDNWIGKKIVLRPDVATFQCKPTACIRVEAPADSSAPAAQPADTSDDDDRVLPLDDIDDDF